MCKRVSNAQWKTLFEVQKDDCFGKTKPCIQKLAWKIWVFATGLSSFFDKSSHLVLHSAKVTHSYTIKVWNRWMQFYTHTHKRYNPSRHVESTMKQTQKESNKILVKCKKPTIFDRRSFRLLFFLANKCCFPDLLLTIFPLPVTLNRFAEACRQHTFSFNKD